MSTNKKYLEEKEKRKNDHIICGPYGLQLTITPIIEQFNLPKGKGSLWVFQHWQSMPKPLAGREDLRNFGYFTMVDGELDYMTIPAEMLVPVGDIYFIPLQWRGPHLPGRVPTAGNYFPNSRIICDQELGKYILQCSR